MLVGILGAGQLGRMLAQAALDLGAQCRLFDPDPGACGLGAGQAYSGAYADPEALKRFAQGLDVCTFEFENVPLSAAREIANFCHLYPGLRALEVSQDRLHEKNYFQSLGIATPDFQAYSPGASLPSQGILKSRRLGYDGKGQVDLSSTSQAWQSLGAVEAIWEEKLSFQRELAQLVVRSRQGELAFYPLVETIQREGILREVIAPARAVPAQLAAQAREWVERIVTDLEYVGVLALELFEVKSQLLANEMAPRVHNSGHWTDRGCTSSQFENHMRAVIGLPLGHTEALGCCRLLNCIGELPPLPVEPGVYPRYYGKALRPGRKVGHLTLVAAEEAQVDQKYQQILCGSPL
jgi:5-(carboxyamino)imidazole ribonucleotide synthase